MQLLALAQPDTEAEPLSVPAEGEELPLRAGVALLSGLALEVALPHTLPLSLRCAVPLMSAVVEAEAHSEALNDSVAALEDEAETEPLKGPLGDAKSEKVPLSVVLTVAV